MRGPSNADFLLGRFTRERNGLTGFDDGVPVLALLVQRQGILAALFRLRELDSVGAPVGPNTRCRCPTGVRSAGRLAGASGCCSIVTFLSLRGTAEIKGSLDNYS